MNGLHQEVAERLPPDRYREAEQALSEGSRPGGGPADQACPAAWADGPMPSGYRGMLPSPPPLTTSAKPRARRRRSAEALRMPEAQ